jgi:hypothetical protein
MSFRQQSLQSSELFCTQLTAGRILHCFHDSWTTTFDLAQADVYCKTAFAVQEVQLDDDRLCYWCRYRPLSTVVASFLAE